jgi:hypothetical protein
MRGDHSLDASLGVDLFKTEVSVKINLPSNYIYLIPTTTTPSNMFAVSIVSLFILALSQTVVASPCVASDINGNLFAFGLGGKDWNAGTQNTWSTSPSPSYSSSPSF